MVRVNMHADSSTDMSDMRANSNAVSSDTSADTDTANMDSGFDRIRVRRANTQQG
jgi:hypothetical protein